MRKRSTLALMLAACGCQAVKERAFSPVTARLDLANEQLATGVRHVEHGVAKLTEVDAKLTETNQRVARIEAQLKATDDRMARLEGQLARTDKRVEGLQGDVATATKAVGRVDATAITLGATVTGMATTLTATAKRVEVMDGRLADANKKVDETNKKLDVVVEAAKKVPGVAPPKE
ncbi:coiled-coil domain-containing protein [Limnoglobus roseus]|uniref:Chromosome partition protein Smc n=1 Tax=Limnoglobus roseus TaxID=2598579 RepID=A0A5C1AQU6_9BACT|nr:hypothetical protein [Limnoglobus roseus]QEL20423.1 Chromosome partition protein Smc [Limnoglobus roseus]